MSDRSTAPLPGQLPAAGGVPAIFQWARMAPGRHWVLVATIARPGTVNHLWRRDQALTGKR